MKFSILLLGMVFILFQSCKTEPNPELTTTSSPSEEYPTAEEETIIEPPADKHWMVYEGQIGEYGQHVVLFMTISEDNLVEGNYYYDKHQKMLSLAGSYEPKNGTYKLQESYKGKNTGFLEFNLSNKLMKGSWKKNAKSSENQYLELRLVYDYTGTAANVVFSKYENEHAIFIYNGSEDDQEEATVTDELWVAKINDTYSSFMYNVTGTNAHLGYCEGIIEMKSSTEGHFYGEDECDLAFNFGKKKVDIEENNCQYYHGARAYLSNVMTKVK